MPGKTLRCSRWPSATIRRPSLEDDLDRSAHGEGRHAHQGVPYDVKREIKSCCADATGGQDRRGAGQPRLKSDVHVADAILHLSATTNGHLSTHGFKNVEKRTGTQLHDLAASTRAGDLRRHPGRPRPGHHLPEWSGSESGGRRYSPFTINIERLKPFHTLTGRQQFYLDHDWVIGMARPSRCTDRRST